VIDHRTVKSSNGKSEKRYVISSQLELGRESWEIELTLANRDSMGFRLLLGREAMRDRILIDPTGSMCLGEYSKEEIAAMYGIRIRSKKRPAKKGTTAKRHVSK
jgi:ribosomal protein S6--L-glutamate ligase